AERRLDRATHAIVEANRLEPGRGLARGRLAGRGVEERAGLVLDENFSAVRIDDEAAVGERLDDGGRHAMAARRYRVDRRLGVAERIGGKAGEGSLETLGPDRHDG